MRFLTKIIKINFFLSLTAIVLIISSTFAKPVDGGHVIAELILDKSGFEVASGPPSVSPPIEIGLKLIIDKGWYLNWINPGDTGFALKITWNVSKYYEPSGSRWPFPIRFSLHSHTIFGYKDSVMLLFPFFLHGTPSLKGDSVIIQAHVEWSTCQKQCVSEEANLELRLPIKAWGKADITSERNFFEFTRQHLPGYANYLSGAPSYVEWWFESLYDDTTIYLSFHQINDEKFRKIGGNVFFFPFDQGIIENSLPQTLEKSKNKYILRVPRNRKVGTIPNRLGGVIVADSTWDSVHNAAEINIPLSKMSTTAEKK